MNETLLQTDCNKKPYKASFSQMQTSSVCAVKGLVNLTWSISTIKLDGLELMYAQEVLIFSVDLALNI